MHKSWCFLCLLLVLLCPVCGCDTTGLKNFESHSDFVHFQNKSDEENGQFFFISNMTDMSGNRVMYLDKENMEVFPLCGKPECLHESDTPDCNANWEALGAVVAMSVSGDELLFCINDGDYCIYRMDTDGTNRRKIRTLCSATMEENGEAPNFPMNNRQILFHRGKVYVAGEKAVIRDGELSYYDMILSYNLTDDKEGKIIFEHPIKKDCSSWLQIRALEDSVFYLQSGTDWTQEEEMHSLEIGEINVATDEYQVIYEGESDAAIYEFYTDGTEFIGTSFADGRVFSYDREEGQLEERMNFDEDGLKFMTMYIARDRVIGFTYPDEDTICIVVRDFEGNVLYSTKRAVAEFEYASRIFCGIDEENFYCSYTMLEEGVLKTCLGVYPLSGEKEYYEVWVE